MRWPLRKSSIQSTNTSNWRICAEDEALGLLVVDRFLDCCKERIYEPLVFVLRCFITKALCPGSGFQKRSSCHFRTERRHLEIHVVSQLQSRSLLAVSPELYFRIHAWRSIMYQMQYMNKCCRASQRNVQVNSKSAIHDFSPETIATHPPIIRNALHLHTHTKKANVWDDP